MVGLERVLLTRFLLKNLVANTFKSHLFFSISLTNNKKLLVFVTHVQLELIKYNLFLWFLQMKSLHESLDRRIASLENLKQTEASQHVEATE